MKTADTLESVRDEIAQRENGREYPYDSIEDVSPRIPV
jgi:hypothetical protein